MSIQSSTPIFLEIKTPSISGKGIFTNLKILKNETICFLEGEEINLLEMKKRVEQGKKNYFDFLQISDESYLDLEEIYRCFNHSCSPNSFIRNKNELVALRDILAGEEITFDYTTTMDDNEEECTKYGVPLQNCKCNCKAQNCIGSIDQFKTISQKRREFYLKCSLAPTFILKKFGIIS